MFDVKGDRVTLADLSADERATIEAELAISPDTK